MNSSPKPESFNWEAQAKDWHCHYCAAERRAAYFEKEWDAAKAKAYGWRLAFWSLLIFTVLMWIYSHPYSNPDANPNEFFE